MFRKACFISSKMAMELDLNINKISKILVNKFGPVGPFVEKKHR